MYKYSLVKPVNCLSSDFPPIFETRDTLLQTRLHNKIFEVKPNLFVVCLISMFIFIGIIMVLSADYDSSLTMISFVAEHISH